MLNAAQLREAPLQLQLFRSDLFREEFGELFVQKPKLVKIHRLQICPAHRGSVKANRLRSFRQHLILEIIAGRGAKYMQNLTYKPVQVLPGHYLAAILII